VITCRPRISSTCFILNRSCGGASTSPDKFGYRILFNIINNGYEGRVYPINPRERNVLGLECFPSVMDIEGKVDLAVVTVPTAGVKQVLYDCIQKGVKAVIVITSGFSEVGGQGTAMESEIAQMACVRQAWRWPGLTVWA
jgi:acyl-CoA synthetase (NDP forming)